MGFGKKTIDAQAELAKIEGERDPDQLQRQRRHVPGMRAFMVVVIVMSFGIAAGVVYLSVVRGIDRESVPETGTIRNNLPGLRLPEIEPAPKVPPPPAPVVSPAPLAMPEPESSYLPQGPSPQDVALRARRLKSRLQGGAAQVTGAGEGAGTEGYLAALQAQPSTSPAGSEFTRQLQPLRMQSSVASRLHNRSHLLTQGSVIDCVLLTRLVTTQSGLVTCQVPSDIYSADGSTVVLDRGTRLTGYQQGGLSQGQARIFVAWSRAESPRGVVVALDSPGVGPLGEAGLGGHVDTHFWERFQGAVFVSILGDLGQWISSRSSRDSGMQFNNTTSGAQDAISTVLERTVDIPPTLYANQGDLIAVMVARDLDFSSVYAREETP